VDEKDQDPGLGRLFVGMGVIAIVAVVIAAGIYYLHFGLGVWALSREAKDWAEFGEYFGGTLGGIYGLLAFIGVLVSIALQRADNAKVIEATHSAVVDAHSMERESRRQSILAVAEAAEERAQRIYTAMEDHENSAALYEVYDKTIIDGMVRALTDIPIHELGSRDAVLALLSLRDQYVFLGVAVVAFIEGAQGNALLQQALDSLGTDTKAQIALRKDQKALLARNVRQRVDWIGKQYRSLKADMGRSSDLRSMA
jgi:hypothetical protein